MRQSRIWSLAVAGLLAACGGSDDPPPVPAGGGPAPVVLKCAVARVAGSAADLVPGPLARGRPGDLVIENNAVRIIIQKGGRNSYNLAEFGGNIIDALSKAADGSLVGTDQFEEFVLGTNIESAPNYQTVEVISPGGENPDGSCADAVIRATGPDDLLDFINGSTAVRSLGVFFPPSADDHDLPVTISTDYTLKQNQRYVAIRTTLSNTSAAAQRIYLVEYLNGSGEVELFQSGYGFGEALATAPCSSCNFVAYAGHEGGAGVSYGLIHDNRNSATTNSSSVSVSGVTALLYGRDFLLVATTPEDTQPQTPTDPRPPGPNGPNFVVPANGNLTLTRYFAVGNGTVGSILDVRNQLVPPATGFGTIEGTVSEPGGPVANAEVALIATAPSEGFPSGRGPRVLVVNHYRTAADGKFSMTQAAGAYELRVNVPGRLAATEGNVRFTLAPGATVTRNFTVDAASALRVTVTDGTRPVAAKVQLVGVPPASDPDGAEPLNGEDIAGGLVVVKTGFYGDPGADPLPPGVRLAEFAVADPGQGPVTVGDTGALPVEPGTYELWVSRGPRHEAVHQPVTVSAGATATVNVVLHEVVPTPGYIHGDFHVHSIDSPDVEVTNRERMATYIAEDVDFFTPSDHDMRVDFAPVIAAMGIGTWIATAPSAEVTTSDYGHYNFWPTRIETGTPCADFLALMLANDCGGHSADPKIAAGSTDWGGQAPLGEDFESAGHYSLSPWQIYAAAAADPYHAGRQVVRQINHISWHFGEDTGGLGIDTGVNPPQSTAPATDRRLDPDTAHDSWADPSPLNFYSDDYDTVELIVGTDSLLGLDEDFYEENLGDWFNLLNQGRFRTAMSNSDTHQRRVTGLEARNQIAVGDGLLDANGRADIAAIHADPHTVGDAVRAGFSTMTNAPFLVLSATGRDGAVAGSAYSASGLGRQGNPLKAKTGGAIDLKIDVHSPLWAPYDQILVFVNGETVRHTDSFGEPTEPARYFICGPEAPGQRLDLAGAGFTRTEVQVVAGVDTARRYETSKTLPLTKASDYWLAVMVRGTKGVSPTMHPVVANNPNYTPNNTDGIRALAMSNPIYIDADGDGSWTPPGVVAGQTVHSGSRTPGATDTCASALPPR